MENTNQYDVAIVNFSAHLPIDIEPVIGRKWVTNGDDNAIFKMIKDAADDSPTNAAIINAYSAYIYGEGLYNSAEINPFKAKTDVNKHLSKADARLIVYDYKTFGGFAIQILWNAALNPKDKKPIQIKYFPIYKLGLNIDEKMCVNGYWYSFNWQERGRFKPCLYPKYTGKYVEGQDVELLVIQRPSSNPFFSQPDYISGIRYAMLEGELSNSYINHVRHGFSATKVVNFNNGVPPTEELKEEYKRKIINQLTGTDNQNKCIVSFNADASKAMTVEDIAIVGLNEQYVHFSEEAEKKLRVAHNAPVILFASEQGGTGLGSNAQEIEMNTALLYRKNISPMRETILDGLQEVFNDIDMNIILDFKDFETFTGDKVQQVQDNNNNLKTA